MPFVLSDRSPRSCSLQHSAHQVPPTNCESSCVCSVAAVMSTRPEWHFLLSLCTVNQENDLQLSLNLYPRSSSLCPTPPGGSPSNCMLPVATCLHGHPTESSVGPGMPPQPVPFHRYSDCPSREVQFNLTAWLRILQA